MTDLPAQQKTHLVNYVAAVSSHTTQKIKTTPNIKKLPRQGKGEYIIAITDYLHKSASSSIL